MNAPEWLVRNRQRLTWCGLGLSMLWLVLWFWPAPGTLRAMGDTALARALPEYQFSEFHEREVCAEAGAIDAAVRQVTASEIRMFVMLTSLRRLGAAKGADRPVVDVAQDGGFVLLADSAREYVLGVAGPFWRMRVSSDPLARETALAARATRLDPEAFARLAAPGGAKAAIDFRYVPSRKGCYRLMTETRIFAAEEEPRRSFARYWRVIGPFSGLLRGEWLQAIERRAVGAEKKAGGG